MVATDSSSASKRRAAGGSVYYSQTSLTKMVNAKDFTMQVAEATQVVAAEL